MEPRVLSSSDGALHWLDENGMPRATNEAWRPLSDAQTAALARAAVAVAEAQVLVPPTHIVRRVGYFLRMCKCGHAGRANFHNGDESAAFELIGSPTWRCGFCLTDQPNPGKDDAEYVLATRPRNTNSRMGFTEEQLADGDERCDERMGN